MGIPFRCAVVLLCGLVALSAGFDVDPMHVPIHSPIRRRLLLVGDAFHGDEIHAQNGERWLALLPTPKGYRTEMVNLRITPVRDPVLDAERPFTGKRVRIRSAGTPVILLNGFAHLARRAVPTARAGNFPLTAEIPVNFRFAGSKVELAVTPSGQSAEVPGGRRVPILHVTLRQHGRLTTLPLVVAEEGNYVNLLWAGDLDGDGRLDLLFEDTGYNWYSTRLFLSSAAKPGQFVGEVAQFYGTGC
ncbi:MAG: hypothetical protein JNM66_33115 [Bryobacterales bacterium]|nr:hypothetical protein [Bryobacterales bacterium]